MSATIELLYEEIRRVERALNEASTPDEAELLKNHLASLRSKFVSANESIAQGRQVLKG